MSYQIKHIHETVLFESASATNIKDALQEAVKNRAFLRGADLRRVSLYHADLGGADLRGAYLDGADLRGANIDGADLGGADLGGADFEGAYLRSADLHGADLYRACLRGADLSGADLRLADLRGADFRNANLTGTNLTGADFRGANLGGANLGKQWIIQGGIRSDGHAFFLQRLTGDTEPMVKVDCRYFNIADAHMHWNETHRGTPLGNETFAIINSMVDIMKIRGLK